MWIIVGEYNNYMLIPRHGPQRVTISGCGYKPLTQVRSSFSPRVEDPPVMKREDTHRMNREDGQKNMFDVLLSYLTIMLETLTN